MKRHVLPWAALIVSTAALLNSSGVLKTAPAAPQSTPESQRTARELSDAFVGVSEFVKPSVVQIGVQRKFSTRGMNPFGRNPGRPGPGDPHNNVDPKDMEEFFKRFFGPDGAPKFEKEQFGLAQGTGSGFVYDDKGHILTNNHVVEGAEKIVITFHDGEKADAKVVGTDPKTDVAIIKVESKAYRPLPKGQSAKVKVGELVLAVGSPFGFDQTVTTGIVSALGRSNGGILGVDQAYEDFIQTDAAINPGNSGGPLVDMDGRVIGINAAIATTTRVSGGVGFAIPIDMASNIAESLIKDGKVSRGAIGVALQPLTAALAKDLGLDPKTRGVIVGDVLAGGPAEGVGLKQGDVITRFDETPATNVPAFRNFVATSDLKKPHTLTFIREGRTESVQITLGPADKVLAKADRSEEKPKATEEKKPEAAKVDVADFGLELQELTPELGKTFGYDKDDKGLLISKVKPGTPAAAAGLTEGLLVTKVVRDKQVRALANPKQFQDLASGAEQLTVYVQSKDGGGFITLAKPDKE